MSRPRVLIARAIFDDVQQRLAQHFELRANPLDEVWSAEQLAAQLQGCQGALTTGGERIDAHLLARCPDLRICANMAVGHNNFDLSAMTAAGVLATNAPDVLTETTADLGFALLLGAARRVGEGERLLRAGQWQRWACDMLLGRDVHGSTVGIVGMGRIGQAVARRGALGFGMRVLYHNRQRLPAAVEAAVGGASHVSLRELLQQADHVLLALPYTPEAHHLIGAAELALMKPDATLTNIARGGIVDEPALARALHDGRLAAAALDVFEGEPQIHPALLQAPRLLMTPHIGSATAPTRHAMAQLAADNLIGYLLHGQPRTPLNPQVMHAAAGVHR